MDIRPIRTDEDHRAALAAIEACWGAPEGTAEGDKLDVLLALVDIYEAKRWPIEIDETFDPIDVLRVRADGAAAHSGACGALAPPSPPFRPPPQFHSLALRERSRYAGEAHAFGSCSFRVRFQAALAETLVPHRLRFGSRQHEFAEATPHSNSASVGICERTNVTAR